MKRYIFLFLIPLGIYPAFAQAASEVAEGTIPLSDSTETDTLKIIGRAFLLGGLDQSMLDSIDFDGHFMARKAVSLNQIEASFFHDLIFNKENHVEGQMLCIFNPSMGVELRIGITDTIRVLFAPDCMEMGWWSNHHGQQVILRQLISESVLEKLLVLKKQLFSIGSKDIFLNTDNPESDKNLLLLSNHHSIQQHKLKN